MKRKRARAKKFTDLRGMDPESPQYWEEVLARENLRMTRGDDPRLVFFDPPVLERIEGELMTYDGRVEPHPTSE